jgi:hypothetical protein
LQNSKSRVYLSRTAHNEEKKGCRLRKRDDWESLSFVIYALIWGQLPWHEKNEEEMLEMKKMFV